MRQIIILLTLSFLQAGLLQAQEQRSGRSWSLFYHNGPIVEHNPDLGQLIDKHTRGLMFQYNFQTSGAKDWEQRYNYPDYGVSLYYADLGNELLGENWALYGHYNFYFARRRLILTAATGIGYNTNPYDPRTNFRNIAFGSHLMSSTMLGLKYAKPRVLGRMGIEAGLQFVHFSNGRLRTPNTSANMLSLAVGFNFSAKGARNFEKNKNVLPVRDRWRYNIALLGGLNEINVIGLDRKPFIGLQVFLDKRISYKSSFLFGVDMVVSGAIREFVKYRSVAFPEEGIKANDDNKQVGVFAGYELRISQTAVFAHLGYMVYYPVPFEGRVYNRLGIKRYLGRQWYAMASVKAHAAKAEALEFGVGYKW